MKNLVALLPLLATTTLAFHPVSLTARSRSLPFALEAKKSKKSRNKGFGKKSAADAEKPQTKSKDTIPRDVVPADPPASASTSTIPSPITSLNTPSTSEPINDDYLNNDPSKIPRPKLNQGQIALENMRRERAEQKDMELRKIKEMREVDAMLKESPEGAAIPERVASRMGQRMIPFVGIPLFGILGTFVAFWYFATYKDMTFQPSLVASSTVFILVFGLLGITYSVMSASWDEDREGSALGVDEFQKNVGNIRDGLSRSRENYIARDKMRGLSEDEIASAINDLDKRDSVKAKRQQSLQSKLDDELD